MDTVTHLGDGAYVKFDGYGYELMANSHLTPTDRIYLEPLVVKNLQDFVKFWEDEKAGKHED